MARSVERAMWQLLKAIFGHIPMVELGLLVFEAYFPALNKAMFDKAGTHIEDVTATDDDVCVFACFEGTRAGVDTADLSRIEGDGLERLFFCEAICHGGSRVEHEVTVAGFFVVVVEGEEHSGLL